MSILKKKAGSIKNFIQKYRPDQQKFMLGDGTHELSYKIKKNKIVLGYSKEFEDDVEITISVKATGEMYKFKKPEGLEARFEAVKRF